MKHLFRKIAFLFFLFPTLAFGQSNTWPDFRGGMIGVPGNTSINVQTFTAGAGTYTWTKPNNARFIWVILVAAGGGGGSGGYSASDSGGGGGSGGPYTYNYFNADILGSTETVTLGSGGSGGTRKSTSGNGNNGGTSPVTETSFGTKLVLTPVAAINGGGGDANAGAAGSIAISGFTSYVGLMGIQSTGAGAGDDIAAGVDGSVGTINASTGIVCASGGAGGGGINGGANFTTGGNSPSLLNAGGKVLRALKAGGSSSGQDGVAGTNGGYMITGTNGYMWIMAGEGGSGGAGAIIATVNGGNGGNGGNCGGGGGGGGASLSGTLGSGAGGNGGAGCVFVISY